ncbi:MAG TPA: heme ABC transporter ATP-binding protein [Lachnospiraceae bacterium]|nr:heme ABC transporter ATP-binding protein [Lachnospiraceae bacterium]
MSEYIVEMRNITKRFPGIIANDDVTIQVRKGEVYALLGENGAGKSTLMSMLYGMYEPDHGEIYIRGEKVTIKSPSEAAEMNIGMVHQHFKLVDNYTIGENIVLGIEPMKKKFGIFPYVDMKEANEKIARLSKEYGLEVNPTDLISDINVSIRQRVEILKMLYREAEILIFDEPTAILTPQEVEFLLKIMEELKKGGKTIILITHKIEEIRKIADRCAILRRGKLIDILDVKTTSTQEMANLMVGRKVALTTDKKPPKFGDTVLEVEGLSVWDENKVEVVKNVSFKVRGGEIFAIAGVSGNGQVELADALAGLEKAGKGKIKLCGKDITHESIRQRTEDGLAYIPEDRQKYGVFLDFILRDNLGLRWYYKSPFAKSGVLQFTEFDKYSDRLIDEYDIRCGQRGKTSLRSMSGGNQQKAIIAREIEQHSPFIIFVQPTRGLDMGAIENIHREIIAERDKGTAILLISLELDEVMNLADTIGVIYGGKLLKIADASTLDSQAVGRYMMGVTEG